MITPATANLTEQDLNELIRQNEYVRANQFLYKLPIPIEDFKDIEQLRITREVITARSKMDKFIYNTYFNAPFQKLVLRSIGDVKEKIGGVYKITNIISNECYIGQSTDIVTRWRWHIRNYISREHQPLYIAMNRYGIDNFTFEILMVTEDQELLDNLECTMINFYQARKLGYNIAKGKELSYD